MAQKHILLFGGYFSEILCASPRL